MDITFPVFSYLDYSTNFEGLTALEQENKDVAVSESNGNYNNILLELNKALRWILRKNLPH